MKESGYYPPGAEFDSNAPYNQVDTDCIFGDDVQRFIDEEISSFDIHFAEYIQYRQSVAEIPDDVSDDDQLKHIFYSLPKDMQDDIIERYTEFRYEDVLHIVSERHAERLYNYSKDV